MQRTERDVILEGCVPRTAAGAKWPRSSISPRTLRYKLARIRSTGVDVPAA
jgi:hypothetical protein